ncbi:hypothetical protein [Idiomarina aminovorans]|uniref:hypothetical protein n=1 Tax=Idiomarina aminovorans TaxID=2914829 RepID=UPI0020069BFC|nr:hypothetical protein [Idiomarina sp. ATCH4]MCK7459065.1 hypothetical protein [Idiomarina sp. ATCH4]
MARIFWGCFIVLMSFSSQASTIVKSCNDCSDFQSRRTAESIMVNGATVVVVDSIKASVSAYSIRKSVIEDNIDVFTATPIPVPEEIKRTFSETVSYKEKYINDVKSDFNSDNIKFEHIDFDSVSQNVVKNMQYTTADYDPINAYDFMSNSSLRRQTYDRLTILYPNYMKFSESWNDTVNAIDISFGQGVNIHADLSILTFTPTIEFADGSYVIAEYDVDSKTFIVNKGVDEGGNDIATKSNSSPGGVYNIRDSEHLADFEKYMNYYWLIDFNGRAGPGQSCTSSCRLISEERWECTAQCR